MACGNSPSAGVEVGCEAACDGAAPEPRKLSEAEVLLATGNLATERRLNAGDSIGSVFRGQLHGGRLAGASQLAVKVLTPAAREKAQQPEFEAEAAALASVRHPSLAPLLGWAVGRGRCFAVYELLDGEDAAERLRRCRETRLRAGSHGQSFVWAERLWAAHDAVRGLAWLHQLEPPLLHRAVSSSNLLLEHSGNARLADFGFLSAPSGRTVAEWLCHCMGAKLPYVAKATATPATEVFAFGVLLLELLLAGAPEQPSKAAAAAAVAALAAAGAPAIAGARERVAAALDPEALWPRTLAGELASLALACLSPEPARRPSTQALAWEMRTFCERCQAPRRGSDSRQEELVDPCSYACRSAVAAVGSFGRLGCARVGGLLQGLRGEEDNLEWQGDELRPAVAEEVIFKL